MAVRTAYRPVQHVPAHPIERALRALVALMLVVAVLATALIAGYEYGLRQGPSAADFKQDQRVAVQHAVQRAVRARERRDYTLHLKIMNWALARQRRRLNASFEHRLLDQHVADAQAAARAFKRGHKAGVAKGFEKAAAAEDAAPVRP